MVREKEYYQALLNKNVEYEGVFFVGVKTTGVFCRPTCPARKPKFENCEFFETAQDALLASYRPCKRCEPLCHPDASSKVVQKLVAAVEAHPERRWSDADFEELAVGSATARRHFQNHFGMTFVAYARARRLGLAFKSIREGVTVIDSQLDAGYESSSGFRDAFSKIMGAPPAKRNQHKVILQAAWIETVLGPMIAIGNEDGLYLLEFTPRRGLEREIERLRHKLGAAILPGSNQPLRQIQNELGKYFAGTLKEFQTPIHMLGSSFQSQAWDALMKIPYGETRSYKRQAELVGNPRGFRAVANANGANQLALIIPCHRIINSNGDLGGYGGGLSRKKWLIKHEARYKDA